MEDMLDFGILMFYSGKNIPESYFTREMIFEIQDLFSDERFPNVVVAMDGTSASNGKIPA